MIDWPAVACVAAASLALVAERSLAFARWALERDDRRAPKSRRALLEMQREDAIRRRKSTPTTALEHVVEAEIHEIERALAQLSREERGGS